MTYQKLPAALISTVSASVSDLRSAVFTLP